jgi:hypothetical protein
VTAPYPPWALQVARSPNPPVIRVIHGQRAREGVTREATFGSPTGELKSHASRSEFLYYTYPVWSFTGQRAATKCQTMTLSMPLRTRSAGWNWAMIHPGTCWWARTGPGTFWRSW